MTSYQGCNTCLRKLCEELESLACFSRGAVWAIKCNACANTACLVHTCAVSLVKSISDDRRLLVCPQIRGVCVCVSGRIKLSLVSRLQHVSFVRNYHTFAASTPRYYAFALTINAVANCARAPLITDKTWL